MNISNQNKKLIKNSAIIALGTIITKFINFLMVPFYTEWLSPEEYGKFDLVSTYVFLAVSISTLQLEQALYRFTLDEPKKSNKYFNEICKFLTPIILLLSFIMLLCIYYFNLPAYTYIAIIYYISIIYYTLCVEYIRGLKKLKLYSLINILSGSIIVLFNFIFVKLYSLSTFGMVLSFAVSYTIIILFMIIYLKPFKNSIKQNLIKKESTILLLLRYSIPLIPNSIAWWITNISDRLIISVMLGSNSNGIYAIAYKIPTVLTIIYGIFNLAFQQTAVEVLSDNDSKIYFNRLINQVIEFIFSASYVVIASTPLFYIYFINEKYYSGLSCVFILLYGVLFLCLGQFMGSILLAKKESKIIGITTIFSSLLNLILNIIFIPIYGIIAAAFTTTISYILMFIFRFSKLHDVLYISQIIIKICIYSSIYIIMSFIVNIIKVNRIENIIIFLISFCLFLFINKGIIHNIILSKISGGINNE